MVEPHHTGQCKLQALGGLLSELYLFSTVDYPSTKSRFMEEVNFVHLTAYQAVWLYPFSDGCKYWQ